MDFVTGLPPSAGNLVVFTVVNRFSKAARFIPLPKFPAAKETALAVFDHVFRVHWLPTDIFSDRGPQFVSQFWREFCRQIGATVSLSSGFHPQTNGQAERVNQILGRLLRTLAAHNSSSWCEQLGWAKYAYNSLPSSSTGISQFHCCLGYQPPLFSAQESEISVPSVQSLIKRCQLTWKRVRMTLCKTRERDGTCFLLTLICSSISPCVFLDYFVRLLCFAAILPALLLFYCQNSVFLSKTVLSSLVESCRVLSSV